MERPNQGQDKDVNVTAQLLLLVTMTKREGHGNRISWKSKGKEKIISKA